MKDYFRNKEHLAGCIAGGVQEVSEVSPKTTQSAWTISGDTSVVGQDMRMTSGVTWRRFTSV